MDGERLERGADVVEARISEREVVLLAPGAEDYLGLDAVASDVWTRLAEPMSFDALVETLAADYDAPRARIAADLEPLIEELVEGGLLRRRPGDGA